MTTMNISLPEEMKAFIEAQMSRTLHRPANTSAPSSARNSGDGARRELEAKFREALESGPATPMTHEDSVALRQEALDGMAGETIQP